MTFLPHDELVLTSKGVTYEVIFSQTNKYLHAAIVILFGAFCILCNVIVWRMKIELNYNGLQVLNLMLRWYVKIMLFGNYNGWNYYFPENIKVVYLLANVLWLVVEIFYFFCFFKRIQDQWERIVNLAILMMIWLPDSYFVFCAVVVLAYECGWVRCHKSMPF